MDKYTAILEEVLQYGEPRADRTGTGTLAIFDSHARFDLREGFPAVTTKRLAWKAVVGELLWFLSGSTKLHDLRVFTHGRDEGQWTIWTPNYEDQAVSMGYENGNLGPVYGKQWRNFGGHDQIIELIHGLKTNPFGRRHMVSAWNVAELDKMALPPCHYGFQCYVSNDGYLDLKWTQRSVDCFLGLPFNIASYALLTHILAKLTGLKPRFLTFSGGDTHIYYDHMPQVLEQISREPRELPTLVMPEFVDLYDLLDNNTAAWSFSLEGYDPHPALKGKMSS
ncbi:thymidylate synthase [Yersinia phage phiR2-01]|uniref:thymidylate synthase n=1 Tax=Yersinia phage phiR2-01 TaxID=1206557 RepID=I7K2N9_9CAUD|nr:thymidylate synthase [Yersinia phage phiR2-01]CCI88511.1 Thymidylate synthase [Yersinia phage phiR2-01]